MLVGLKVSGYQCCCVRTVSAEDLKEPAERELDTEGLGARMSIEPFPPSSFKALFSGDPEGSEFLVLGSE